MRRAHLIMVVGVVSIAGISCGGSSTTSTPTARTSNTVVAATTATPADEATSSFQPPTATGGQLPALTAAATGTWTGEYGTLTFNSGGTAHFSIKNCGTSAVLAKGRPFNVLNDCTPMEYVGKIEVRAHEYAIQDDTGSSTILQAYLDGDGNLNVGSGTLDELDPSGSGAINIYARGTLIVGNSCTYKDPSSAGTSTAKCSFATKEGRRVLTYEIAGASPGDAPHTGELVQLPDLGLIVEPAIYVGKFTRN